jgi:hypothetical protein
MQLPRKMTRRLMTVIAVVGFVSLALAATIPRRGWAWDRPGEGPVYGTPFPIVMLSEAKDDDLEGPAKEIARVLGIKAIARAKSNPVCCVWVEISHWTPNPGAPGFFILNQPGGSIISASDLEQLTAAIARLKASVREHAGRIEVPMGLMTSYPVISRQ